MIRLPSFRYRAPSTVDEAARILADHAPGDARLLAGGTDLLPNMKRRQQVPVTVVGLRRIEELRAIAGDAGLTLGAGVSLTRLTREPRVRESYRGLWQAAVQVATPHLRNMATLGGNLCADTRCNYYDQSQEWRAAIGFCMKKDGDVCWVAPGSSTCLAVSSTDLAPMLVALGARVTLAGAAGRRQIPLTDLFLRDGIDYLTRNHDEVLTAVELDPADGWRSTYWKLRRRGAFDFPVLSVAAAIRQDGDGPVQDARIVLGAIASRPVEAGDAAAALTGRTLDDDTLAEVAHQAARVAKPMDNTDFGLHWRKRMATALVRHALAELRGDDMTAVRTRLARWPVIPDAGSSGADI
ncbi:MAG: FAD binding domain-containing protein [Acidobacteriota bacterium]